MNGSAASGSAGRGAAIWADAVRALALFAIDPAGLGGISLRAGAGTVRDHWLSLLKQALPPDMPLRRLPLHAGDDRLLGGLDLAATLQANRPIAQRGLLAEADGGVLLLAMAERIEPATAARLRAALDDRAVTLQREGLPCLLPTRFGIVALDEGADPDERPPTSLLDRLAFHLDLTDVSVRDIGDRPWTPADLAVARRVMAAGLPDDVISVPPARRIIPDAAQALCGAALALGIDSLRAPLLALHAARIAAALDERTEATDTDLGLAARLVFVSRATRFPPPRDAEQPEPDTEPDPQDDDNRSDQDDRPPSDPDDDPSDPDTMPDQPLADVVLQAALAALPPDLLARLARPDGGRGLARAPGRAGQMKASTKRGRPIGTRQGDPKNGARLHLLETLKAAAPWQALRRHPGSGTASATMTRFEVRREDFRIIRFRQRIGTTTVFAVDASGSAAMQRLNEAKGAVELLLADCYVRRDQVALIAFRGRGATVLLPPTGSLLRAKRSLAGLPGGGPTPLAAGIDAAAALADTIRRTGRTAVITLLTDARANIARDGSGGRPRAEAEALESARALRAAGVATLLVDTSPRPNPFARRLAETMRAHYVPLPYADASALSRAVRSAAAA
ncbi:magnesium chelatase subunit D [Rhodopila sp.]|uniref:magnesium chelatase subunit D n=1 Tax=Rhodopila sp. TaxID=2480087 RepID=UPI003D0DC1F0